MRPDPSERRLARRLAAASASAAFAETGEAFLVGADGAARPVDAAALRRLVSSGAVAAGADQRYRLTGAGRAMVRRLLTGGEDLAAQHQTRERRVIETDGARQAVTVDLGESPLAWLRARKGRDGKPLIDDAAFAAGEKLRSDFTRGQMMRGISASWSAIGGAGRGGGHAGGIAELTDAALAARLRVERALTALGPELSGAVVDFCCFLKGIDRIEAERGWPQRSAKLVLRLGLEALARHYGFDNVATGKARHGAGGARAG